MSHNLCQLGFEIHCSVMRDTLPFKLARTALLDSLSRCRHWMTSHRFKHIEMIKLRIKLYCYYLIKQILPLHRKLRQNVNIKLTRSWIRFLMKTSKFIFHSHSTCLHNQWPWWTSTQQKCISSTVYCARPDLGRSAGTGGRMAKVWRNQLFSVLISETVPTFQNMIFKVIQMIHENLLAITFMSF